MMKMHTLSHSYVIQFNKITRTFGVGIVSRSSGSNSSSLFCTMMPYLGSNRSADAIEPTSTMYL